MFFISTCEAATEFLKWQQTKHALGAIAYCAVFVAVIIMQEMTAYINEQCFTQCTAACNSLNRYAE